MTMNVPNVLSHVSIGSNDLDRSIQFYDRVLEQVGAKRQMEIPNVAVAYGKHWPEFWVQRPLNGQTATVANGVHFAFIAPNRESVKAFYRAAIENGGTSDGEPGGRPHYGPDYYGCFVFDLDGHKIEAAVISGSGE